MTADEQNSVRATEAVRRITAVCQCEAGAAAGPSRLPVLRFGAEQYTDLMDQESEVVTLLPLLNSLSDEELGGLRKLY